MIHPIGDDLEQLFVRVRLHTKHIIFGALYLPPTSHPDLYEGVEDAISMQGDLTRLEQWCTVNRMQLHTAKCVVLSATRARSSILVIDLGVCITPCFDFRPHYARCTNTAMRTSRFYLQVCQKFQEH